MHHITIEQYRDFVRLSVKGHAIPTPNGIEWYPADLTKPKFKMGRMTMRMGSPGKHTGPMVSKKF